jgi:hypothetical protein
MTQKHNHEQETRTMLECLEELLREERHLATLEGTLRAAATSSVGNDLTAKREQQIVEERQLLIRRIRAIEADLGRLGR